MRDIMFRIVAIITLLVSVAFVSALASVSAQTSGQNISAIIPFQDYQGRQTLKSDSEKAKSVEQELARSSAKTESATVIAALH